MDLIYGNIRGFLTEDILVNHNKILVHGHFCLMKNEKVNRPGAINIIDLANIDTCAFIATDDLGRSFEDGSFEVLGRIDSSDSISPCSTHALTCAAFGCFSANAGLIVPTAIARNNHVIFIEFSFCGVFVAAITLTERSDFWVTLY